MFKYSLLALALTAVAGSAFAAPVANLKINGDIKPPTCTVNGGDQADLIYNMGTVSPSLIPQSTGYSGMPMSSNSLTVNCDAATYLTFKATDTSQNPFILPPGMNSNFRAIAFNMVDVNAPDKTIGGVSYKWSDVKADGADVFVSRANDGTYDSNWASVDVITKNATNGWTTTQQRSVALSALDLISAKEFSATISTRVSTLETYNNWNFTYILSKDELKKQGVDISAGIDYSSNVALNFSFGV